VKSRNTRILVAGAVFGLHTLLRGPAVAAEPEKGATPEEQPTRSNAFGGVSQ